MTSAAHRSESELGAIAAEACAGRRSPRLLLGGLGMGFTLRAALDGLPPRALVSVAELQPAVVEWCRGPLAPLTDGAVHDTRVSVDCADVAAVLGRASPEQYDAVALDLFSGPRAPRRNDPHYGVEALTRMRETLRPGGALVVWAEQHDPVFAKSLSRAGYAVSRPRPGRGGLRHVVYLAVREAGVREKGARKKGVREAGTRGGRPRAPAARRRS